MLIRQLSNVVDLNLFISRWLRSERGWQKSSVQVVSKNSLFESKIEEFRRT